MKPSGLSESDFQKQVMELARLRGWRVAHFRCVRIQRRNGSVYYETPVQGDGKGFPDLILIRGPRMIVMELKVKSNRPSQEQLDWLEAFRLIPGVESYCLYPRDWKLIEEILEP